MDICLIFLTIIYDRIVPIYISSSAISSETSRENCMYFLLGKSNLCCLQRDSVVKDTYRDLIPLFPFQKSKRNHINKSPLFDASTYRYLRIYRNEICIQDGHLQLFNKFCGLWNILEIIPLNYSSRRIFHLFKDREAAINKPSSFIFPCLIHFWNRETGAVINFNQVVRAFLTYSNKELWQVAWDVSRLF